MGQGVFQGLPLSLSGAVLLVHTSSTDSQFQLQSHSEFQSNFLLTQNDVLVYNIGHSSTVC
jgi:hypothetical protein